MNEVIQAKSRGWGGEFCSTRYFLMRALALGALFLMAHLAGLREYTTFLSGTAANPEAGLRWSSFLGMVYIVLYLGLVVAAPILILAAGLLAVGKRMGRETNPT